MEAHELHDSTQSQAIAAAADTARRVIENVARVIHAPQGLLERCVLALLCEGHIILEDFPGVGKTMLAKSLARSLDCEFARIQATPDLLPSDITGVNVYNLQANEFEFRPGPVFANLVLVDEINRASPKTQSALLEC
ncbi:MAG: MoxR-like ATPase, partial [Gaiellales bacterium]|nr:MoxR-like ATPase [Gaiellales bacterium]